MHDSRQTPHVLFVYFSKKKHADAMFISVNEKEDCLYHFSSRFFSSQNAMAARSHTRQAFATFTRLKNPILGLILSYMHISVKHARVKKKHARIGPESFVIFFLVQ
jgi:hypothetical protein